MYYATFNLFQSGLNTFLLLIDCLSFINCINSPKNCLGLVPLINGFDDLLLKPFMVCLFMVTWLFSLVCLPLIEVSSDRAELSMYYATFNLFQSGLNTFLLFMDCLAFISSINSPKNLRGLVPLVNGFDDRFPNLNMVYGFYSFKKFYFVNQ